MSYQQAEAYLHRFTNYEAAPATTYAAENFDLRRMDALLELLDNPHLGRVTVHIAGTKGKGSIAAMTAAVLQVSGYRTGLFTSPHLCTFRERFRVDGQPISEEDFVALVDVLQEAVETYHQAPQFGRLTTFELTTALAFLHFRQSGVTTQVLEAGMGGRLDATNVVPQPNLCIITPISYDHTQILGDTLEAIAGEKAGIIKPGVPVVMAQQPEEARTVIARRCYQQNAPLLDVSRQAQWSRMSQELDLSGQTCSFRLARAGYQIWLPLLGSVQVENAATVIVAAETLRDRGVTIAYKAIERGLAAVRWPGRLQIIQQRPLIILDGAHNGASAARLDEALTQDFSHQKRILVIGVSADKDLDAITDALAPATDHVIATSASGPRATSPDLVAANFASRGVAATAAANVSDALAAANALASPEDLICVTGSFFVLGEALQALGEEATAQATFHSIEAAADEPLQPQLETVS